MPRGRSKSPQGRGKGRKAKNGGKGKLAGKLAKAGKRGSILAGLGIRKKKKNCQRNREHVLGHADCAKRRPNCSQSRKRNSYVKLSPLEIVRHVHMFWKPSVKVRVWTRSEQI